MYKKQPGFTIVELLVVIVVIGILAAITIVSYTGISQKAKIAAIQSDLANASTKLKMYYALYGYYPTAIDDSTGCPTAPTPDPSNCISNTIDYSSVTPHTFTVTEVSSSISYSATESTTATVATAANCPAGFITVPGSSTYGTSSFCVMKYEAKNVGGVATSQAALNPWVSINQTTAITTAAAACSGCHLITEAEWMTIAQNVLSVPSNWSSSTVGTGYIYSGHNDNVPANSLVAALDNDPYNGTGQSSPSNQKRTLTLTNGEVIWDLAGNVSEWTNATIQSPAIQPGASGGYYWRDWTSLSVYGTLSIDPYPSATGIPGSNNWNSSYGVGRIFSSAVETGKRVFIRSGYWGESIGNVGVLTLFFGESSNGGGAYDSLGFRVSR